MNPLFPHLCVCAQALPRLIQERDQLKEELERTREEKHQARELIQRAREERSEAKEEEERLREERDKAREESRRAKEGKERLDSKVALLQEKCDRLGRRVRYTFLHRTSTRHMFLIKSFLVLKGFKGSYFVQSVSWNKVKERAPPTDQKPNRTKRRQRKQRWRRPLATGETRRYM